MTDPNATEPEAPPTDAKTRSDNKTSDNKRAWAIMAHLSPMVTFLMIPGFVGPLGVWLIKRGEDAFIARQAKASFNFAMTVWLCGAPFLVLGLWLRSSEVAFLVSLGQGLWVLFSLWVGASLIFGIVAAFKAAKGKSYNYPAPFKLIK